MRPSIRILEDVSELGDSVGLILDLNDLNSNPLQFTKEQKENFDRQYLDLIASLGKKVSSKFWWASSLSEKNELLSKFYPYLYVLEGMGRLIREKKPQLLTVLCRDKELCSQISFAFSLEFTVDCPGLASWRRKKFLRNWVRFLVKTILKLLSELQHIFLSRQAFKGFNLALGKDLTVLKVWVDHRSYKGGSFEDSFFTVLLPYLKKKQINFVLLADIFDRYAERLATIAKDKDYRFVPLEYFFQPANVFKAWLTSISEQIFFTAPVFFNQVNVSRLVEYELSENFYSTKFFENILYYFKLKDCSGQMNFSRFINNFENYAWEKMCILGIEEELPAAKIVGFQHAFVAKNSFRYFLGRDEAEHVPSPDEIVTMGEITRDILIEHGSWPKEKFRVGAALRQYKNSVLKADERSLKKNILVCFTQSTVTTINTLEFLYKAGLGNYSHIVYLRFHPHTSVEKVLKEISFTLPKNFVVSKDLSLFEDFAHSGVLVYDLTTVGLEALQHGLPVVYLNINNPYYLDPLFEINYLKEEVSKPEELLVKINSLLNMSEREYQEQRKKAREYLKKFFVPVSDDALEAFVK